MPFASWNLSSWTTMSDTAFSLDRTWLSAKLQREVQKCNSYGENITLETNWQKINACLILNRNLILRKFEENTHTQKHGKTHRRKNQNGRDDERKPNDSSCRGKPNNHRERRSEQVLIPKKVRLSIYSGKPNQCSRVIPMTNWPFIETMWFQKAQILEKKYWCIRTPFAVLFQGKTRLCNIRQHKATYGNIW